MIESINFFITDEEGASVIEYAVLIALIAAAVIVIIGVLGLKIDDGFKRFDSLFSKTVS